MDIQSPGTNPYFGYKFVPALMAAVVSRTQQLTRKGVMFTCAHCLVDHGHIDFCHDPQHRRRYCCSHTSTGDCYGCEHNPQLRVVVVA